MLLNFQIFWYFSAFFLLLISSLIELLSENVLCMISIHFRFKLFFFFGPEWVLYNMWIFLMNMRKMCILLSLKVFCKWQLGQVDWECSSGQLCLYWFSDSFIHHLLKRSTEDSVTVIVDLYLLPFSSTTFWLTYFDTVGRDIHIKDYYISFKIFPFYHNVNILFKSYKFLCSDTCFLCN